MCSCKASTLGVTLFSLLLSIYTPEIIRLNLTRQYPVAGKTRALLGFWILARAALGFGGRSKSYVQAISGNIPRGGDYRFKQRWIGEHARPIKSRFQTSFYSWMILILTIIYLNNLKFQNPSSALVIGFCMGSPQ